MATYLVVKRMVRGDGASYAGDTLTLDPNDGETMRLMEWGYITPVPDNYASSSGAVGTEPPAEADSPVTIESLTALKRDELNEMAADLGIEDAEGMPNKAVVAEAILAKAAAEDEDTDEAAEPEAN